MRRRAKLSAHMAMAGAVTARASMGAERIRPISAPESPREANQTGMYGELAPVPTNRAA